MKEFLSRHGVAYREIDVRELDDPMGTLRAVTGGPMATPTVVIGDDVHVGFDPDRLRNALDL